MTNVFKKRNYKLVGILLVIPAVLYIINILTEIEWYNWQFKEDATSTVLLIISRLLCVLFYFLLSVSFFAKKRSLMFVSYLSYIAYTICSYTSTILINIVYANEDGRDYDFWDSYDFLEEELFLIFDILSVIAFIVLIIDCFTKKNFSVPTEIAVMLIDLAYLYSISYSLSYIDDFIDILSILREIIFPVALSIAYFTTERVPKPARKVSAKDELLTLKAQFDNKQISEEEYNSKRAEIISRL